MDERRESQGMSETVPLPPVAPMMVPAPAEATDATAEARENIDSWVDLALVLGVALAPVLLTTVLGLGGLSMMSAAAASPGLASASEAAMILDELISLGVLAYVLRRQKRSWADLGLTFRVSDLPVAVLLGVLGYVGYITAYAGLWKMGFYSEIDPSQSLPHVKSAWFVLPLVVALLNPFFEELIVRAYLMLEIHRLTGRGWLAIAVSTLLQAFYHLYQGWQSAVSFIAMFLVFSIFYRFERRITPILIAHLYFDLAWTIDVVLASP